MTGKENTEINIKNALFDGAFYYLQDKEWQNNSIFSKVISSKEAAEHMLFECLQRVGIEEFKLHARSLGGVDLNKIANNLQRDYAIVLYYLCNDLHELKVKDARETIMHRFGLKKQDFSNCVGQFKSHINKKFKRDNYPIMLSVFQKLVTWTKGKPKKNN
tara:strand:- start:2412 stop:2891 length:480 start_codon:yes stop_codon:yes gene_type:complete